MLLTCRTLSRGPPKLPYCGSSSSTSHGTFNVDINAMNEHQQHISTHEQQVTAQKLLIFGRKPCGAAWDPWLNLMLMQPMKPIDLSNSSSLIENGTESVIGTPRGERDSFFVGSENENYWHTPKRHRIRLSRALSYDGSKSMEKFKSGSSQSAKVCLQNVCSVSDLRQRLVIYFDAPDVEEVLCTMIKIEKDVEDGRFKMK